MIFSPDQILPCYVVHYEPGKKERKKKKDKKVKNSPLLLSTHLLFLCFSYLLPFSLFLLPFAYLLTLPPLGAARVANPFSGASGGYTAPKPAYGIGGGLFAGKRLGFPMLGAPLASPGMTFGGGGSYEEEEAEYLDEYDN